jgi:hypothetical protein
MALLMDLGILRVSNSAQYAEARHADVFDLAIRKIPVSDPSNAPGIDLAGMTLLGPLYQPLGLQRKPMPTQDSPP